MQNDGFLMSLVNCFAAVQERSASRVSSGRPLHGEHAEYAGVDIDRVEGEDCVVALASQARDAVGLYQTLTDSGVRGLTYAKGKWTVKEVIGHMIDDERIFCYRALCLARNDVRSLAGFDENAYAQFADAESRPIAQLAQEYGAVRLATLTLFESLGAEAWLRRGTVNGYSASARGLAFHIAGHELRHLTALREVYGLGPTAPRQLLMEQHES